WLVDWGMLPEELDTDGIDQAGAPRVGVAAVRDPCQPRLAQRVGDVARYIIRFRCQRLALPDGAVTVLQQPTRVGEHLVPGCQGPADLEAIIIAHLTHPPASTPINSSAEISENPTKAPSPR